MQQTALTFAAVILLGSLLLSLPAAVRPGEPRRYVDALFTSVSATCVTGLTPFDTYTHWTLFGQTVLLLLIQTGGLGFMTVFAAVSLALGRNVTIGERKVLMQSAGVDKMGGLRPLVKRIAVGTALFELAGAVFLASRFCRDFGVARGIYFAVFHSVSAFCNAGFDLMGAALPGSSLSLYRRDPLVLCVVMCLISVGGLGFVVWNDLLRSRFSFRKCSLHTKIVCAVSAGMFAGGTALFLLSEYRHALAGMPFGEKLLNAAFMAVSPRTAGFFTVAPETLSEPGTLLTMIYMFVGGSPGSTAGGVKTTTVAVLLLACFSAARGRDAVAWGRGIPAAAIRAAASVLVIYLFTAVVSAWIMCAAGGFTLTDAFFECFSAVGTVGLTRGVTPALNVPLKCLVAFLMYGGRLGLLSLAAGIGGSPGSPPARRPEGSVMIG